MEYYSAIKKNEILTFATIYMNIEGIMLNEMSEKHKYHMISLTYRNLNLTRWPVFFNLIFILYYNQFTVLY